MKLHQMAYDRDPRIKAALAQEKAEEVAAKNAKKQAKQQRWQAEQDKLKATEAAVAEKEVTVVDAKAEKEAKKLRNKLYRETVKKLIGVCAEKMPGTLYDKFYCDELVKKYPTKEVLDEFIQKVEAISIENKSTTECVIEFLTLAGDQKNIEKESKKLAEEQSKPLVQPEEEKKEVKEEKKGKKTTDAKQNAKWDDEEVALLTLGIKKFPPGTNDRWRVVADFIGTKNQKEVIAKAKDIKEQQEIDI